LEVSYLQSVKATNTPNGDTSGVLALVDKAGAAALLGGVSQRTIDRLREAGELETQPLGPRLVRITVRSIEAYLSRQRGEDPAAAVEAEPVNPFAIPLLDELRAARGLAKAAA
jgi:hypothetical protein